MTGEGFLYDERCDGGSEVGTEATVLDVDADGNTGIGHRGVAHEGAMVFSFVLCCACLAADTVGGRVDSCCRAVGDTETHATLYEGKGLGVAKDS